MGTPSLRIRLLFEDRSILSETQRSEGMNHSWLLLKLQQHQTISDVCTHLLHIFKLNSSCPNGILLSMDGFTLPPFESTEILKDKEIIHVKKKGGLRNLVDDVLEPEDDALLLLANNNNDKGAKEYQGESDEVDKEQGQDEELPEGTVSKKRKASMVFQKLKRKKQCLAVVAKDEDEAAAETEEIENSNNEESNPMKIISTEETNKIAATSNKKVRAPSTVKRTEELQENVEGLNQVSNAPEGKKAPSRSARRKKAKRQWMQELAKIAKKKPQQAYSKPEITEPKSKEANDQPKGLLYWKQASKKPVQNRDVGPVVTGPGNYRYESLGEDQVAKQTGVWAGKRKWNGNSGNRKVQNWGKEKLPTFDRNDDTKRVNKESFKTLFKDSKVPVVDPNDFDKLPPCSEPNEGDVITYRLLELNSSWIPELSSFRVGRISYYDAKDIVLIPVKEYPIVSEKVNEDGPNDSLYGEDGTLEINYSALVDVRIVKQYEPDSAEPLRDGVDQTHKGDDTDDTENFVSNSNNNKDVPKHSNPGEVNPRDRGFKNTEIPEPYNPSTVGYGLHPSSYGGAGPSTSTGPVVNKAESSEVKEGQKDNSFDPWLSANKPDPSQENNSNALGPTANGHENGSSWGRPWSAFVVSRSSSVIQQNKGNEWHAGSSRGGWKPMSRGGVPRGRGKGRGRGRGYGRGRGHNGN